MQINSSFYPNDGTNIDDERISHSYNERKNHRYLQKRNNVVSTCCICRSGSAADTQYIADIIRHQLLRRKILHGTSSCISDVAHLIKNYLSKTNQISLLKCIQNFSFTVCHQRTGKQSFFIDFLTGWKHV